MLFLNWTATFFCRKNESTGLIRGISDLVFINYIQDITVKPGNHFLGYGKLLLNHVKDELPEVRTTVLLTDERPSHLGFCKSLRFEN